jgi:hypothetical protein
MISVAGSRGTTEAATLGTFGRHAGSATLILSGLAGATTLRSHLDGQRRAADVGLQRLARVWGTS